MLHVFRDSRCAESLYSPAGLIELAAANCGISAHSGDIDFAALETICAAFEAARPNQTTFGKIHAQRILLDALGKRLRLSEHLARYPEIRSVSLPSPVFIVAPFRTGSTFLHRLLAQDRGQSLAAGLGGRLPSPFRAASAAGPSLFRRGSAHRVGGSGGEGVAAQLPGPRPAASDEPARSRRVLRAARDVAAVAQLHVLCRAGVLPRMARRIEHRRMEIGLRGLRAAASPAAMVVSRPALGAEEPRASVESRRAAGGLSRCPSRPDASRSCRNHGLVLRPARGVSHLDVQGGGPRSDRRAGAFVRRQGFEASRLGAAEARPGPLHRHRLRGPRPRSARRRDRDLCAAGRATGARGDRRHAGVARARKAGAARVAACSSKASASTAQQVRRAFADYSAFQSG